MPIDLIAYLDPGTGSMILQAIAGGIAALAVTARFWWHRATSIFRRTADDDSAADSDVSPSNQPR